MCGISNTAVSAELLHGAFRCSASSIQGSIGEIHFATVSMLDFAQRLLDYLYLLQCICI